MGLEGWALELAGSPWVYVAMYLFATIDGFFPPIPSESVVIALATLSMSVGEPNLLLLGPIAALGAFTGDQIAYTIGTRVRVHDLKLFSSERAQRTLAWAERALARRGASFIIAARYIPIGRVAVNMTAGAVRFPRGKFTVFAAVAAVMWSLYSTLIGMSAGAWLGHHPIVALVVGVIGGGLIGIGVDFLLRHWLQRREPLPAEGAADEGEPPADADEQPHRTQVPPAA